MDELLVDLDTIVRQQSGELATANQQLKKTNNLYLKYLSIVHDLRTPLSCIKGLTENLLDEICDPLSPLQQGYLEKVHWNADRLEKMTDNLLDFTKIEAEKLPLKKCEVNVPALVKYVVEQFQRPAKKKKHQFQILCKQTNLIMTTDEEGLFRVLTNLLDNAVKYTPTNGLIRITVDHKNSDSFSLAVEDTGPGIAPESLPNLCKPFWQGQLHQNGSDSGLGLGLYNVKSLVDLLQGKMAIDSELGKGTKFTITFPFS